MTAYVSIRPAFPRWIRTVCRPCDLAADFPRRAAALAATRQHNHDHHQKEHR